jgi:hypothetical protein
MKINAIDILSWTHDDPPITFVVEEKLSRMKSELGFL